MLPIELDAVQRAKDVLHGRYGISARDALHVAVMERHEITRIMSFDGDFDRFPGVDRVL